MSPDPLTISQREAIHELQLKHLREKMSASIRVAVEIEALEKRALRWAIVAFVAVCLAAIFAVLFVRARAEKTSDLTIDNRSSTMTFCAKKPSCDWVCSDSVTELEKMVDEPEPASSFGTQPSAVIL